MCRILHSVCWSEMQQSLVSALYQHQQYNSINTAKLSDCNKHYTAPIIILYFYEKDKIHAEEIHSMRNRGGEVKNYILRAKMSLHRICIAILMVSLTNMIQGDFPS